MEQLQAMLAPVAEFHKAVEDAKDCDLRLYWDVRLVHGADTFYAKTSGSSTLPGLLGENRRSEASGILQTEIIEKIAKPIVARLQKHSEDDASDSLKFLDDNPIEDDEETIDEHNATSGGDPLGHANDK